MDGRNKSLVYNGISIVFVLATILYGAFIGAKMMGEEVIEEGPPLPTQYIPPTATHTLTPTNTLIPTSTEYPTFTPSPTDTLTPTTTLSPVPTIAPSATITNTPEDTLTPSNTPTASISPTFTPTATPTGPTPTFTPTDSPFFFTLREDTLFTSNTVNSAGCAWQGVGGSVLGIDGQESTTTYQIHVYGPGFDGVALTGSNSLFGQVSGWEIPIETRPEARTYFIKLESAFGTPLSQEFQLPFPGNCNANLALVRFIQTSPIGP
jgi:hypothetical protein